MKIKTPHGDLESAELLPLQPGETREFFNTQPEMLAFMHKWHEANKGKSFHILHQLCDDGRFAATFTPR